MQFIRSAPVVRPDLLRYEAQGPPECKGWALTSTGLQSLRRDDPMAVTATSNNSIRPLVAGNWKMNGLTAALCEASSMIAGMRNSDAGGALVDVMLCPPVTLLSGLSAIARGTSLLVGGQDCHAQNAGAHTGDISAEMLRDAGAVAVIVGHSERRIDHGESDAMVKAKAGAASRAGLTAIICVGETAEQRQAGATLSVVGQQLAGSVPSGALAANTVIAYEPVWAIGTGLTPTAQDVADVHALMRQVLAMRFNAQGAAMRLLYGGSVKPSNAAELMAVAHVNGALVGGASLKAADFLGIIAAYYPAQ